MVSGLAGQFASLSEQMRRVSGDLGALQAQLTAPMRPPVQYPVPVYPPLGGTPPQFSQPRSQQPQSPQPQSPQPQLSQPQHPPRQYAVAPPRPPVPEAEPWWQRDGVISRVLAVAGAGVTLVGVVMLLVLAAQAGWFGPELRVGAGALFSIGLVYAGSRVHRKPGGRIGGIATAATGIAGLYLDVVAVTVVYGWLEPAIGLVAAFGIAAAGVALAVSWNSQPMAVLILVGTALCAPVVTGGITLSLIAFFTATFVAGFAAQLGRDWPMLNAARTLPVVIATLIAIAQAANRGVTGTDGLAVLTVSATIAVFGIATSVVLLRRDAGDTMASAAIGVTAVPVLVVGALFTPLIATLVEGSVAFGCAVVVVAARWIPGNAKIVLAVVGSVALLQAVLVPTSTDLRPLALLLVAAVLVALAERASSTLAYFVGAAFGAFGALGYLVVSSPASMMDSRYATGQLGTVVAGVLLVGVSVGLVYAGERLSIIGTNVQAFWVVCGVVSLYASTSATVALGAGVIGGNTGFVAGHCAATIEWMAAAMALLVLGLRSEKYAHTALLAGLSLTAASVAKLFLFDLVALDGLFRVGAFIVVGLLLLLAGTRYAKVFAERSAG